MDPTSIYDNPQLQQARSTYQTSAQNALTSEAEGIKLPDMLKEALTKKFSTDNPLVATRERQLGQYLNTTTQAPLDYTHTSAGGNSSVVYNPLQQANIIQARRTTALTPLTSTNYLLGLNQGGMGDIIDATSRAQQGNTRMLQGKAELARTGYTDLLSELSAKAEAAFRQQQAQTEEAFRNKQFEESVRQYNQDYGLKAGALALKASGSGGGLTATQQKEAAKKQADVNAIQQGLQVIKDARAALAKTGSGGQYTAYGLRSQLPSWVPGSTQNKNSAATNAALSQFNTQLFSVAGKALTASERKVIEGLVTGIGKPKTDNEAALNQAEKILLQKLNQTQGGWH